MATAEKLVRTKEIDPSKGKDDDRPPEADEYNLLWEANRCTAPSVAT